ELAVWHHADLIAPFRIHALDRDDEAVEVAEEVVALPLAFALVAEHDLVAMFGQARAPLAELVVDRPYVLRLSRHEEPSRAGAEGFGILVEPLRRIVLGIDRHGDEEEVAADLLAELFFNLRQSRGGDRADVLAARIDEVDDDGL